MKNILLFTLLNILSVSLFSQIQVSDIEKLEYLDGHPIPFEYNDSTFIIFRQKEKTSVFGVDNSGINLNFVSSSRPFASSRVGYSIYDHYLFDYYSSGYIRIDLLTSEVLDTISYDNEVRLSHRGGLLGSRYIFNFLWDSEFENYLYIYDLDLKDSHIIKYDDQDILFSSSKMFIIENNKAVYYYNLENKQKELLYTYENQVSTFGPFGDQIFVADTMNAVNIFDKSGIVESLECFDVQDEVNRLHLTGNSIIANVARVGSNFLDSLKIYDYETCELRYKTGNFRFSESSEYPENTILLRTFSLNYQNING